MNCHCPSHHKEERKKCCQSTNSYEKKLTLKWRRLVVDGKTCERCIATEKEVDKAFLALRDALANLGIEVLLEKETINLDTFKQKPKSSNEILINGIPLENYISANVGQSKCCGVCRDEECRTLDVEGKIYEVIPAEIIIRAALVAAAKNFENQEPKCACHNGSNCK